MKTAIKTFFSSLWEDFVLLLTKHTWRLIGHIIMFVLPIATLLGIYVEKVDNQTKWIVPFAIVLPLAILIIIYWAKARRYFAIKVQAMKSENNIQKGKHAGAIIICDFLGVLMTIAPFVLVYILIQQLELYMASLSNIFIFMIICESVGGALTLIDTIKNV